MRQVVIGLLLASVCVLVAGCNSQTVRSTAIEPVKTLPQSIPDALIPDVNIAIFDAGIDTLDPQRTTTTPGIRRAEGHYVAQRLKDTLERSREWGLVRVVPSADHEVDVMVTGKMIKSNGETLAIEVTVTDARGQRWFSRRYEDSVSRFAYDLEIRRRQEPFQNVYNRVANDMIEHLRAQPHETLQAIRSISELRFAARFAPEAFSDYLSTDGGARYSLKRLPAENDPVLARVRNIRVRDQLFVDHLQEAYTEFDRNMAQSYDHWRQESFAEAEAAEALKSQALARKIGGALAVIGGILAMGSDSSAVRNAGVIGIGGGAYAFKSGLDKSAEARIHTEAMKELSESLNAEIQPQTIALTDRTVELNGTVEEQYAQWQTLLQQIYELETGSLVETSRSDTPSPE